jgi:drug/metabolite transporter (DMT)-like permease
MFLGESLTNWQLPGLVLVMAGVLLVTWHHNRDEVDSANLKRGTIYAVGAVLMMAVGIVMVKEILETRPFLWTVVIRQIGGVAGMLIYVAIRQRWTLTWARFSQRQPWGWIVLGSFLGSYVSMMMWVGSYKLIPASEASILNETASAWIVLLAWLLLGESIGGRKLLGLLLTFTGVVVMLLV